jgi:hypothetical protein
LKEVQPENTEVDPKFNGTLSNREVRVEPDESQTTISYHPLEGAVEDVTGWSECYTEEQSKYIGNSS